MPRGTRLGDLERSVMETLWGAGDSWLTVREVHDALAAGRTIAYTTVMTVLERMTRKGLLAQQREGRAYRYHPVHTRAAMTAELMRDALGEFAEEANQRERNGALVAFVGDVSEADRSALREALAELDRRTQA